MLFITDSNYRTACKGQGIRDPLRPHSNKIQNVLRKSISIEKSNEFLRLPAENRIDDKDLTIQKLAENLEKIRMGLVYNGKGEENAEFVIEEMNKETAGIFTKLQLGEYIPG